MDLIAGFISKTLDPIIAEFEKCVKDNPVQEGTNGHKKPGLHLISDLHKDHGASN